MTPAALRALAEEATPGPWEAGRKLSPKDSAYPIGRYASGAGSRWASATRYEDARLIALAPDLALLCAEMGDILAPLAGRPDALTDKINAALAKLGALEAR